MFQCVVSVSVVVPTTLANPFCEQSLASVVEAADRVHGDVVLVVNGPGARDRRPPVRSHRVRVLYSRGTGPAAARNLGMREARHDVVLFTDDDCVVPPTWCATMSEALAGGNAAAAGPTRVAVRGPITAFLNYQRLFDAPPLEPTTVRWVGTLNCGIRRSAFGESVSFDEQFPAPAGEDAEFGYRMRDAGATISWLSDAEPVVHLLPEEIGQITGRLSRYGRAWAQLVRRCGRWREAVPAPADQLTELMTGGSPAQRMFREIASPAARTAFTAYLGMLLASYLVAYLDELGAQWGCRLVEVDHEGLAAGWPGIASAIADEVSTEPPGLWTALPVDARLLTRPVPPDPPGAVAAHVARHVAFPADGPPPAVRETMARWHAIQQEEFLTRVLPGLAKLMGELRVAGTPWSSDETERRLRGIGLGYAEGCYLLERLASR